MDADPEERDERWRDLVSRTHLPWALDVGLRPADRPDGHRIVQRRLGDVTLLECWTGPCTGHRRRAQVARTDGEFVGVLAVVRGEELLRVGEEETVVGPSGVLLWPSQATVDFRVPGPLVKRTLLVPRARLLQVVPHPEAVTGRALDPQDAALLVGYLDLLARTDVTVVNAAAAGDAALELLGGVVSSARGSAATVSHRALLAAAHAYVETRLGERDLTAEVIAHALAVVERHHA